jgi:hypothetical protein
LVAPPKIRKGQEARRTKVKRATTGRSLKDYGRAEKTEVDHEPTSGDNSKMVVGIQASSGSPVRQHLPS